jgi:hypothetical protein
VMHTRSAKEAGFGAKENVENKLDTVNLHEI